MCNGYSLPLVSYFFLIRSLDDSDTTVSHSSPGSLVSNATDTSGSWVMLRSWSTFPWHFELPNPYYRHEQRRSRRARYYFRHTSFLLSVVGKFAMSDTGTAAGTSSAHWRTLCKARKAVQDASIPQEWKIKVPPDTSLDVRFVTEDCGLLSSRELDIIDLGTKDVSALVRLLADKYSGYTSLEVTTAYLRSAIIAHQVVSLQFIDLVFRTYQTLDFRQTVSPKSSLSVPLIAQKKSTDIW